MNRELKIKLRNYLKWRVKHNKTEINHIELAKYFKIDNREAETLLQCLCENQLVDTYLKFKCRKCNEVQSVRVSAVVDVISCCNDECKMEYQLTNLPVKTELVYKINEDKLKDTEKENRKTGLKVVKEKMTDKKVKVFLSYAHEDENYKNELDNHLAVQKREGKIETWHDRKLVAGSELDKVIKEELMSADIIVLLISSDFFASVYCYENEMNGALERHKNGEAIIIPVIVRTCDWQDSPIGKITALPIDGKSIASFSDRDEAYMQVVNGIKKAIQTF